MEEIDEEHINFVQSVFRMKYFNSKFQKLDITKNKKSLKELKYVIHELIKTEKRYVSNLMVIKNIFIDPLNSIASDLTLPQEEVLLKKNEVKEHFQENVLNQMVNLHEKLYTNLNSEFSKFPLDCNVVKVMLDLSPYLKLYTPYVNQHTTAVENLKRKIKKNSKLKSWFEKVHVEKKDEMLGLDVYSLMVQPIQRIPRYVLFFKTMLKNYQRSGDNESFTQISKSLNLLRSITSHVDKERRFSKFQEASKISKGFHIFNEVMVPHRKFYSLYEKVMVKCFKNSLEIVKRHHDIQLFSDLLIFYKREKKKLIGALYLVFSKLADIDKNSFQIFFNNARYVFYLNDPFEKSNFYELVEKQITENREKMGKRGVVDPAKVLAIRRKIIKDIFHSKVAEKEKQTMLNETYEKVSQIEKVLEGRKEGKKNSVKKVRKRSRGIFGIFSKKKKKKEDQISLAGDLEKVGTELLAEKKEKFEAFLKKIFGDIKSNKEHGQKLLERLKWVNDMIVSCMSDDRFTAVFPFPLSKEGARKLGRSKSTLYGLVNIPVVKTELEVSEMTYIMKHSVPEEKIQVTKNFEKEYEKVVGTQFRFDKSASMDLRSLAKKEN